MPEPSAPRPDRVARWGLPAVGIAILVFVALIAAGFLTARPLLALTRADPFALAFWTTLALDGLLVAMVVIIVRLRGSGSVVRDLGFRLRPVDLAIGPGAAIAGKIVAAILVALLLVGLRLPTAGLTSNIPFDRASPWSWALLGVIGCVTAPVAEELLFRGLILRGVQLSILRGRGLRGRPGAPWAASPRRRRVAATVAIAVSAVLFAAFHLYEATSVTAAVVLGTQILVIGVVHGILTVVTGRMGPAILSHVANNAISFALLAALPQLANGIPR